MLEVIPVYIRLHESVDKSTGKTYIHHSLVETHRGKNGLPKQTTVMNLGKLALPQNQWPELALALESMINNQIVMDDAFSDNIKALATELMKIYKVYPKHKVTSVHSK
ncbi:MAG: hypothetical protein LBT59_07645 [Clostridiales bacterium]|jgi:hypothetical protein|nr:hypothetical protein [Clostridiales bacterium]